MPEPITSNIQGITVAEKFLGCVNGYVFVVMAADIGEPLEIATERDRSKGIRSKATGLLDEKYLFPKCTECTSCGTFCAFKDSAQAPGSTAGKWETDA